jgi:hypothetical protein
MANNTIKRWVPLIGGGALLACTAVFLFRKLKDSRPAEGSSENDDQAFRGKWKLPEGARLARPGVEDIVDQAAVESFPASDPPGFTPTRVG